MNRDAALKLAREKWGALAFADEFHGKCFVGVKFTFRGKPFATQPYGVGKNWQEAFERAKLLEPGNAQ